MLRLLNSHGENGKTVQASMNRKQRNSLDNHLPLLVTLPNPQLGEPALIVPGDAGLAGPVGHHLPDGLKDDTRSPVGEVNFPSQLCHLALSAPCHAGKRDCPHASTGSISRRAGSAWKKRSRKL